MTHQKVRILPNCVLALLFSASLFAQIQSTQTQPAQTQFDQTQSSPSTSLPRLIRFSGVARDLNNRPLAGVVGVTFLLYAEQTGGAPLWLETQNVQTDFSGHYSVLLGSTSIDGLPADIFTSEQARWIGVQIEQQPEQPRSLLVSAPYALKAGDAETLGGLPASAFVLAAPGGAASATTANGAAAANSTATADVSNTSSDVTTTGGTVDAIPLFSTATNIQNSLLTQTGTTAINVAGKLNLPALGTAASSAGFNSRPLDFAASAYDSSTSTAVAQTFQWQAQAAGNDTSSPSATLNLLYGAGTASPAQTGLHISSTGQITFATGQTFPGTGTITGITTASGSGLNGGGTSGTLSLSIPSAGVTNTMLQHDSLTVTAGTGLTGGGAISLGGSTTLNINTAEIPELGAANAYSAAQTINSPSSSVGLTVGSSGGVGDPQVEIIQNNTSDYARLRFTDTGSGNAWDLAAYTTSGTASPVLNFWNSTANLNVLQLFPTLAQTNVPLYVNGSFFGTESTASNASGTAVAGIATATTGAGWGVQGQTNSTSAGAYGVIGLAAGPGGSALGVYGQSLGEDDTAGVFGQFGSTESNSAGDLTPSAGVWGDGGSLGIGVLGTTDQGYAGYFFSETSQTPVTGAYVGSSSAQVAFNAGGTPGAGAGTCTIYYSGSLECEGTISGAVQIGGGSRTVGLAAIHSPKNWFEDAGSGQLVNGVAVVAFDAEFLQTVNSGMDYKVFPVPNGDCKGLYVTNKTATSFEVRELGGGTSNVSFDYRIMALRKGYEKVRFTDLTAATERRKRNQAQMMANRAHSVSHTPTRKPILPGVPTPVLAQPSAFSSAVAVKSQR